MKENKIINLLGRSENDKEVIILLKENNFSLPKAKYYTESLFIYNSAKKTVISFNKLDDKYGYINTDEREILATYINEMVLITGLKLDFDITEKWRNW